MNASPDDTSSDGRSYELVHFAGGFSNEDCDRLRGMLRRADEVGGWPSPPQAAGAAWIVVTRLEGRMIAASRYGTDLVFTGQSVGHLETVIKSWIDEQVSLPIDRPERSNREDREASRSQKPDTGSTPPVR